MLPATPRARIVRLDLDGQTFRTRPARPCWSRTTGEEQRRPYSIAARRRTRGVMAVLELLVGVNADGTPARISRSKPGELVDVDGPLGIVHVSRAPEERRFVFIAGGTGIAPLRAMMQHALHAAAPQHRPASTASRTPDEFAYEEELRALARDGRDRTAADGDARDRRRTGPAPAAA